MSQQINLYNPIFLKQKKVFTALPMAQALGVIVLGALAVGWYASHQVKELEQRAAAGRTLVAEREARLLKARQQFAPRHLNPALAAEVAQAEQELHALKDVEQVLQGGALGNTAGYAEYFRALARQNVSGLWLTGLTISGAGHDIGVQGRAMQPTLIPSYIARLTSEKVMRGKTFASLDIARPGAAPAAAASADAAPQAASAPYVEFSLQSSVEGTAK
ncbi:hypothetical protein ACLB1G_06450 [Oxalobacteraceae bacterium A2-2]